MHGNAARRKLEVEGKHFMSNNCGRFVIEKYIKSSEVYIRFEQTGNILKTCISSIMQGAVRDNMSTTVQGVGIVGDFVASKENKQDKAYSSWNAILSRCLNSKVKEKQPTYADCTVDGKWHYFKEYKAWYDSQIGFDKEGYQTDKDLLVRGNLHYSEDTCCLIPRDLNTYIAKIPIYGCTTCIRYKVKTYQYSVETTYEGEKLHLGYYSTYNEAFRVLKAFKESALKEYAERYKGLVSDKVYNRLMNFEIYCE